MNNMKKIRVIGWREFYPPAALFIIKERLPVYKASSSGPCSHQNSSGRHAHVPTGVQSAGNIIIARMSCFSYLSSFLHNSCSRVGVRGGDTGSGTARTRGTRGCGCWCWAWAWGSSHQRRRPLLTAASRWCRPPPPARNPPPPQLGRPSHRCKEEHAAISTETRYPLGASQIICFPIIIQ